MNRIGSALALGALIAVLAMPTTSNAEVVVIGSDPPGDWGANLDPTLSQVGHELGGDLLYGAIQDDGDAVVRFVIGVTNLPEGGGTPELIRYVWDMNVNGVEREIDGKFANYSRGTCDPTSGQCPPPRDPGPSPFFVRGNCTATGVRACQELGVVQAVFDPATDSITIPVSLTLLGVDEGCGLIEPKINTDSFPGGHVVSIASAYYSQANAMPLDYMVLDEELPVEVCHPAA